MRWVLLAALSLASCRTPPRHLDWATAAPGGEVPSLVLRESARARSDGRRLLVYVGATWCEPCRRFHEAAAAGKLDAEFSALRLLEFDFDRDEGRLRDAGYVSALIPLFAAPGADGRASGRQIYGSVKGDGAVGEIVPRLQTLLRETATRL